MKTIAIIVASFCVVGAAMAQKPPPAAPRRPHRLRPHRPQRPRLRPPMARGRWRNPQPLPHRPTPQAPPARRQVAAKKLKGAALTSSATKCCKDAAKAAKLKGAAETSFTKKCVSDATKA